MSIIDKAAELNGFSMDGNLPEKGHRLHKDFGILVGTARKLEGKLREMQDEFNARYQRQAERLQQLTEENAKLRRENDALKLKERMREIELPKKDQERLLGVKEEAA
jgi:hypothetical protein